MTKTANGTPPASAKRPPAAVPAITSSARLDGKIALVTGAAGNLGGVIVRRYLAEGATVVMTGRDPQRLAAARDAALADSGADPSRLDMAVLDGADAASVRDGIAAVLARHGRLDILVNNAGSAGPKQVIGRLPLTADDLEALRAGGSGDTETVGDAARNIMGVAWNLVRAAAASMQPGGSIINVSTIFSRTEYYGRAAYTVPKAAMNALSQELSKELGARGIRVNLLFPGPIASERIRTVFATMDGLRGDAPGTTADTYFGMMTLAREVDGAPPAKTFPVPADIAATCVFLGSDDSRAFNGHDFEVTHGMRVRKESRATWLSRPTMRSVDGVGLAVLVAAGDQIDDAIAYARVHADAGAEVLLGFHRELAVRIAAEQVAAHPRITVAHFDRLDTAAMDAALERFTSERMPLTGALILPTYSPGHYPPTLADALDGTVESFTDKELCAAIAVARSLNRYWTAHDGGLGHDPRFVFITNESDREGDMFANFLRAGVEELVRVWRDESAVDAAHGRRKQMEWGNQIVRYFNREGENLLFAAGQAARLLLKERRVRPVNLYLPENIGEATGSRRALAGPAENITGLHLGKVALITGGSAGIGGQVARLLALAGAKVMMVSRRASELEAARARIVGELEDVGFSGVERRVQVLADIDVGDPAALDRAVEATLAAFGRIDYLINNAGVSGAEEMAVDMSLAAWRHTQAANLVSNYHLIRRVVPLMKAQGSGYILNVSSYFGGEKFLAVAYPNRSDYAVSKAGQRAMAESLARHLGPEVQINAIAPGPVDGDRLAGLGGKPGLFERRGRLILENKRLNAVHAATIKAMRRGVRAEAILSRLARNDTVQLAHDTNVPRELRDLALAAARESDGSCTWDRFLLTESLARRLVARLRLGGWLLDAPDWADKPDGGWLLREAPDDRPWLPPAAIVREAEKVRDGVLSQLHLGKMPTEGEVAQATVFFLADRAVSGETFMPSGGLNVERSNTERELFGSPRQERLDQMRGKTVWLIGEHLTDYLAEAARACLDQAHVGRVVLLARSEAGAAALAAAIDAPDKVETLVVGDDVEAGMDAAMRRWGRPISIVSTAFAPLPSRLFGDEPLDAADFAQLVEDNLTQHFRVTRKASLYDGCQLVLVSPDVAMGEAGGQHGGPAFALANFVKSTLHAFTSTVAVENERLVHDVPVNQINLTRRVRSEEPRNVEEHLEEVRRFARAVLLAGAPLPDAEDSRYRARIYRGMSITV